MLLAVSLATKVIGPPSSQFPMIFVLTKEDADA